MVDLLGWGELILVLGLALVIVGPKDLPKLFYALGRWSYKVKALLGHFQTEWDALLQEQALKEAREEDLKTSGKEGKPNASSKTFKKNKKNLD